MVRSPHVLLVLLNPPDLDFSAPRIHRLPSGHGFGDPMIAQNFASAVNEGIWPNGHGSGNG